MHKYNALSIFDKYSVETIQHRVYVTRRMINECGAVVGISAGRGNRSTRRKPAPISLVHHKSHMTFTLTERRLLRWEIRE
jgi:hypothetical protein